MWLSFYKCYLMHLNFKPDFHCDEVYRRHALYIFRTILDQTQLDCMEIISGHKSSGSLPWG